MKSISIEFYNSSYKWLPETRIRLFTGFAHFVFASIGKIKQSGPTL